MKLILTTVLAGIAFSSSLAGAEEPPAVSAPAVPAATSAPSPAPEPQATPAPDSVPAAAEEPRRSLLFSAGVGYRSTHWSHAEDPGNTEASYNVDDTQNTIVEGDFAIPKVGLRLGFNLMPESGGLSNIQQAAGYIGIKGMSLVSETGSFSGRAHFRGKLAPGQSADMAFKQVYHYTELDYTFLSPHTPPFFLGLRYTQWNLPAEVALISEGQTSGPTVMDPDFRASFYSLLGGFDFFKNDWMGRTERVLPGWGVMMKFEIGLGLGSSHISDTAAAAAKSGYGKTFNSQDPGVFTFHSTGQLGPKYVFVLGNVNGAIGVGYDWNALFLVNTGSKASGTSQVQPVAYPNFFYQGWMLRSYLSF